MSNELLDMTNHVIAQLGTPMSSAITPFAKERYAAGLDLFSTYRGDPEVLWDALQVFETTGSRPYLFAGIALVLNAASYIQGDRYEKEGLQQARTWLQQAQAAAPGRVEIDFVEALTELNDKRLPQARAVLDRLAAQGAHHFQVCLVEMYYADRKGDIAAMERWYARALELAATEHQRVAAMKSIADAYLMNERWHESLQVSRQIAEITPDDPWLWHNMSIAYACVDDYDAAADANGRALSLMEFGAARDMERKIARHQQRAAQQNTKGKRGWAWWKR